MYVCTGSILRACLLLLQKEHAVKGKSRMKISVSPHGLKLFDAASMVILTSVYVRQADK